jgi:hypothetical protein
LGLSRDHTTVKLAQCTKTFRAGTGVAFQAAKTLTSVKAGLDLSRHPSDL